MKRILFFLSLLPYLASAQVAKDTVTVLTIAQIPAGAIRDTTNFTFVQDNAFKKATFDSLYKYTRVKLLAAGAITSAELANALSGETGTGAAVFATSPVLTTPNLGTPTAATLTNATGLPIGTGLTGLGAANRIPYATSATALATSAGLTFDGTNFATTGTLFIGKTNSALSNTTGISLGGGGIFAHSSSGNGYIDLGATRASVAANIGGIVQFRAVYRDSDSDNTQIASIKGMREDATNNSWKSYLSFETTNTDGYTISEKMRIISGGNVGIGTDNPAYKLDVNGNVRADTYYSDDNSFIQTPSDIELKKNIEPLSGMLEKIKKLNPVSYEWNDLRLDQMQSRDNAYKMYGTKIGLLAQDMYNVFPEFTGEDAEGNMTVSYISLIVPMLKAIQEQQQQIEQLKQRITQLENK